MKPDDPLAKLLKAAARAEREARLAQPEAESPALPFGLETRVLAARKTAGETFPFLPLFRGALACASVIAVLSAGLYFRKAETPDVYEYTSSYSIAAAYIE
jgi:hypothetical protein